MFKSHFSQQSTPIHGFLTPSQPQTVHTSPLRLVYFMICHNVSWRIMIFSWYCISWCIMIPYSSKHLLRLYLKWFFGVQTSPNWGYLDVFGALIMIFSWDFIASKAFFQKPLQSLHLHPSAAMGHHPRNTVMARRRRLFGAISAALALLLEVTKPGKWWWKNLEK